MPRPRAFSALSLTAWSLSLPLVGCYANVPVAKGATPALGESTLVLTAAGARAVQQKLGDNVRSVDGPSLRVTTDSIEMTVTDVMTVTRERFPQTGVPPRKRTWTLVGIVAGVLAFALGASAVASASSSGEGGGGIQP